MFLNLYIWLWDIHVITQPTSRPSSFNREQWLLLEGRDIIIALSPGCKFDKDLIISIYSITGNDCKSLLVSTYTPLCWTHIAAHSLAYSIAIPMLPVSSKE